MKTEKLSFKGMETALSRDEMKSIMAGSGTCLNLGEACNDNVQCCSNRCSNDGGATTGKSCNQS